MFQLFEIYFSWKLCPNFLICYYQKQYQVLDYGELIFKRQFADNKIYLNVLEKDASLQPKYVQLSLAMFYKWIKLVFLFSFTFSHIIQKNW